MREESQKPRRELPLMEEDSGGEEDLSPEDRGMYLYFNLLFLQESYVLNT